MRTNLPQQIQHLYIFKKRELMPSTLIKGTLLEGTLLKREKVHRDP